MAEVIIIMGSQSDLSHAKKIAEALKRFELGYEMRIASAHKSPVHLLEMLQAYEQEGGARVYITVAGRSNALSGMVDAAVAAPVIACPPYSDTFAGADVFSSLRMPSGVAPALVLDPEGAALLAAKILGRRDQVKRFQQAQREKVLADDKRLKASEDI